MKIVFSEAGGITLNNQNVPILKSPKTTKNCMYIFNLKINETIGHIIPIYCVLNKFLENIQNALLNF